ncbi:MAG: SDR family NAD(P)-dependent oxidoreductase, partial [Peptococcaceae bacterium]|nr:SDR family NAD(P)-dependent oxidoreductase [Peptococcaceae bacterium]
MDLSGKVAVVTGGTRGIGFEIVKKYLQNGAAVVLFGSRQETVEKALAKLRAEHAEWKADGLWPNLSKPAEVEEAIQKVKEKYG